MGKLLLVCVLGCLQTSLLAASESDRVSPIGPGQLDYYLYQAFNSPLASERYPLNHIGIDGETVADGFLVSAVLQDYPAHRAGILRGDVIVSSNDQPFHPVFSFNERTNAPQQLNPGSGSYELEILRNGQELLVTVSPVFENLFDSYRAATVSSVQEFSSGNKVIGYVQLWALSRNSADLLTLQQLIADLSHCDGIIMDLRSSYGFLDREHLRLFDRARAPLTITAGPDWLQNWQAPTHPLTLEPYRKPLAILIDSHTRAAAELLALMLATTERNTTLGASTAGRLGDITVGEQGDLSYTPALEIHVDGQQIEGVGIQPEQVVPFPFSESRRDDPQFESAVTLLLGVI